MVSSPKALIMRSSIILIFIINLTCTPLYCKTWYVGSTKTYTAPSKVSNLVAHGDTVMIDAEVYSQDVCFWKANHLLIRGVGGRAHLKSGGKSAGQKAIWVVQGDSTIIENIEFSECRVPDKNGAGIRLEGTHLVIRNCYFHHNEDGILAGDNINSNVIIEYSEFAFNGFGDGLSHNLYINHVRSLTFQFNYSHDAIVGHLLKSRAHNTYILYNRLTEENGDGSYEIDLPNAGTAYIIGNIIEQGLNSQNSAIISYGLEGLNNPTPNNIYLSHNTIINNKTNGTFLQVQNQINLYFSVNNIFAGPGTLLKGTPVSMTELSNIKNSSIDYFKFTNKTFFDFSLTEQSPAINSAIALEKQYLNLKPLFQYVHPSKGIPRSYEFVGDVGALEAQFLHPFESPIEGTVDDDFIVVNYLYDSIITKKDYNCGNKTYNGSKGTDFYISGFEQMDSGVKVLAVDSGVVLSFQDGLFDKETQYNLQKGFGNYICIQHPGKYFTWYTQLKKNSIKVKSGDKVYRGQYIADVGSSGNSEDAHLHFEINWNNQYSIDPFAGNCGSEYTFWKNQLPYDSSYHIWKSGIRAGQLSLDTLKFHQYSVKEIDFTKDYYTSYWNLQYGLRKNDIIKTQWFNDQGIKVWEVTNIITQDDWHNYYWTNVDTKTLEVCEHCKVRYIINGLLKDEIEFKVKNLTGTNLLESSPPFLIQDNYIYFLNEPNEIICYDITGRSCLRMNNLKTHIIDLSALPSSFYILYIKVNNLKFTQKFLKK